MGRRRRGGARTKQKPKRRTQRSAEVVLPKYVVVEGNAKPVRVYAERDGPGNRRESTSYYYLKTIMEPKTTTSVDTDGDASAFSLADLADLVRELNKAPIPNALRSYVDPLTRVLPRPQHDICRIVVEGGEIDPCICDCNAEDGILHPSFKRRNKAPMTRKNIIAVGRDTIMKKEYMDTLRAYAKQHYAKRTVKRYVPESALHWRASYRNQTARRKDIVKKLFDALQSYYDQIDAKAYGPRIPQDRWTVASDYETKTLQEASTLKEYMAKMTSLTNKFNTLAKEATERNKRFAVQQEDHEARLQARARRFIDTAESRIHSLIDSKGRITQADVVAMLIKHSYKGRMPLASLQRIFNYKNHLKNKANMDYFMRILNKIAWAEKVIHHEVRSVYPRKNKPRTSVFLRLKPQFFAGPYARAEAEAQTAEADRIRKLLAAIRAEVGRGVFDNASLLKSLAQQLGRAEAAAATAAAAAAAAAASPAEQAALGQT